MKPWTSREIKTLETSANKGAEYLSGVLGRSPGSITSFAQEHGISLRKSGERRGRRLAIPTGELSARLKAERINPDELINRVKNHHKRVPCPDCGRMSFLVPATGFCKTCHHKRLSDERQVMLAEAAAVREDARLRKQEQRERDRKGQPTLLRKRKNDAQKAPINSDKGTQNV